MQSLKTSEINIIFETDYNQNNTNTVVKVEQCNTYEIVTLERPKHHTWRHEHTLTKSVISIFQCSKPCLAMC